MPVIDIGDGRIVDYVEGALRAPPPPPPKPKKPSAPRKKKKDGRTKSVTLRGFKFKCDPRPPGQYRGNPNLKPSAVPGFLEWAARRSSQLTALTALGRQLGQPQGMSKKAAEAKWVIARRKAKADMERIKQKIDLSEAAEEALTTSLEVMRSPLNHETKLKAAKLVLDFTMAKPVSKQEVSINAAEQWLSSLGKED